MKSSDFEYDLHRFQRALVMSAGGCKRAKEHLIQNAVHWQGISSDELKGNISVHVADTGDLITGEVLGRKFTIDLLPFVDEEKGYIEAVITTPSLRGSDHTEAGRFLVAANGSILTSDKEELLSWDDDFQSYRLLIAVARRVLGVRPQV